MTSQTRPSLPAADESRTRPRRFGLSWVQIVAVGFASITATTILSFFSISGTLIGAAVFSMASAIGNAVYGQSLRTTKEAVKVVLPVVRADPASPTVVLPVTDGGADDPDAVDDPDARDGSAATDEAFEELVEVAPVLPTAPPDVLPRLAWKRVAILAAGIFLFVIAVVTAVELIAGRPLTDVVRGDDSGSGTSLFGGTTGQQVPTMTVTVTPSVVFTTPTVTQTAPAVTQTVSPNATSSPSAGVTATPGPSGSVPASSSPSAGAGTVGSDATRTSSRSAGR